MGKVCARPTCNNVATTRFSFESRDRLIILDRRLDEWGGSGVLCEAHADRLTVPRGWALDDRRIAEPRLFAVNKFETSRLSPMARTARRLVQPEAHPSTPLPLDGGDNYALPDGYVDRFDEALTNPLPTTDAAGRSSGRHYDDGSTDGSTDGLTGNGATDGSADEASNDLHAGSKVPNAPGGPTPMLNHAFDATESRSRPTSLDKLIPRKSAG